MFARIHHRLRLLDGERMTPELFCETWPLGERTLWIQPMLCGPDALGYQLNRPGFAELRYAARGVEQFWGAPAPAPGAPLRALLGAPRARIAVAIEDPDTTTRLAAALGLSKATVSYHLAALVEAGIADRARFGRSVYYVLTARGRTLVADFGGVLGRGAERPAAAAPTG
jgi:DNA-binding transcriptional ArsR family regulator